MPIIENPSPEFMNQYHKFIGDYNNPMISSKEIETRLGVNHHQYLKLRKEAIKNNDIPEGYRERHYENSKYYRKNPRTGYYEVIKTSKHNKIFIGSFETEAIAEYIVFECLKRNWNINNQIQDIIEENKVKPKYYTFKNGSWIIQRKVNGKMTYFCSVIDEYTAIKVVEKLEDYDWDKNKLEIIFKELCIKN